MALQRNLRILRKTILEARTRLAAARQGAQLAPGKLRVPRDGENLPQTYLLERAFELGPIFKVWLPHKLTTCIVGHDIARRFLSETEGRVRAGTPDLSPLFPHGFLRALEGEVHRTYRRQILEAFNATPLQAHEAELRRIMREGLARLTAAPQPAPNATIRATMKEMTTEVFLRLILGVARGTAHHDALVAAYDVYAPDGPFIVVRDEHTPAYDAIRSLVDGVIADIEANPDATPSLLRHLVHSGTADDTTIGNLIQMVEATRYDLHGLWT
jgi:cytochrome P450